MDDWLAHGLQGRSAKTISTNREVLSPLIALIGAAKLRELTAADVRSALAELANTRSTRTVQIAHNGSVRAIRHTEANDLAGRNVVALVASPEGLEGILTAYWLVSGYTGLRAWRAIAGLAVVTALLAVAFHLIGFAVPPSPVSYWTSLLYAFRATLSLTDDAVKLRDAHLT